MIIILPYKLKLVNVMRHLNRHAQNAYNKKLKSTAREGLREVGFVALRNVVSCVVEHRYPGQTPDTGNCFNSAKAAIDGFVQAGLLIDDSPDYLDFLVFAPPRKVEKEDEGLAFCFDESLERAIIRLESTVE
jgi:hypothetical protein